MKFLITGNLSILANPIYEFLSGRKHHVVISGFPEQINMVLEKNNFQPFPGDAASQSRFFDAHSFDVVIYIATREDLPFSPPGAFSPLERVGLEHVLTAADKAGVARFIYISSLEIYGDAVETLELNPPFSDSFYGQILQNEEKMCEFISGNSSMRITILRPAFLYGNWSDDTFINRLIRQVERNKRANLYDHLLSPCHFLHIDDFLDFLGLVIENDDAGRFDRYNLSGEDVNFSFIQQMVGYAFPTAIISNSSDKTPSPARVMDCAKAKKNFTWQPQHNLVQEMQIRFKEITVGKSGSGGGKWFTSLKNTITPLFVWGEVILGAFLMHFLTIWTDTLIEFKYIDYRLLYVILIGSTHGLAFGILAALLACLSILIKWYNIGLDWALIIYNVENWIPFALLFLAGSVTGYLHDKNRNEINFEKHQTALIHEKYEFLYNLYDEISAIKNQLRDQLVGYRDSFGRFFRITNELNELDADQVFIKAIEVLEDLMQNDQISIYSVESSGCFGRLEVKSKSVRVEVSISINLADDFPGVLETVRNGEIFQNKDLDSKNPAYIAPIMNGNALIGLVVLWEAAFEQYSLYYLNLFRITTGLVQSALIRAAAFLNAQREKQFLPGTAILRPEAFRNALDLRKTMRRKKIADYLILSIERGGKTWQDLFASLSKGVRDEDVVGVFAENAQECYVLLNHARIEHLDIIQERLGKLGLVSEFHESIEGI
jgi:nucleoside-diphosphate-sugar epimerase